MLEQKALQVLLHKFYTNNVIWQGSLLASGVSEGAKWRSRYSPASFDTGFPTTLLAALQAFFATLCSPPGSALLVEPAFILEAVGNALEQGEILDLSLGG